MDADAQADLNVRWVQRSFCWFCQAVAHDIWNVSVNKLSNILSHNCAPAIANYSHFSYGKMYYLLYNNLHSHVADQILKGKPWSE